MHVIFKFVMLIEMLIKIRDAVAARVLPEYNHMIQFGKNPVCLRPNVQQMGNKIWMVLYVCCLTGTVVDHSLNQL